MDIWDSKCLWDIIWVQDTIGFQDIYMKMDGKWLLDSMGISDSKCLTDIIWLYDTIGCYNIYRKSVFGI